MDRNKLWSDVLAYRPLVEMTRKPTVHKENQITESKSSLSVNLTNYESNNPFVTIKAIDNSLFSIRYTTNMFEQIINDIDDRFKYAYDNGDVEYINKVIEENRGIAGNSVFEAYSVVRNDYDMLSQLQNNIKESYFGDSNDTEIEEEHLEVIGTLKAFELDNYISKLNYSSMAVDSYINSIISEFTEDVSISCDKLYRITTVSSSDDIVGDIESIKSALSRQYDTALVKSVIDYEQYSNIPNGITGVLNQALNSREDMNSAINADSSIPKYLSGNYIDVIMKLKDNSITTAFNDADELVKHLLLTSVKKEDYINSLSEREGIKNIFPN